MGNRFASMMDSFCAIDVLKNTYKVTKLLQIPGSELIVTVLEDFGA